MSKVVNFPKAPDHLRPEMIVRWVLSHVDELESVIVVAKMKDYIPVVSISSGTSPYLLTMAASLLNDAAMHAVDAHETSINEEAPKEGA